MRAAQLDTILREFRQGLEQIYGSRLVRLVLFGSQARDEAEPESDIDFMVVLRGPVNPHLEIRRLSSFASGLSLKYDVMISCVYVSEEAFDRERSPLLLNVRREGIPIDEQEGLFGGNLNRVVLYVERERTAEFERAMAAMAADSALREEIQQINKDFEATEADGQLRD
jgi:predicted nucleotidyltransferase